MTNTTAKATDRELLPSYGDYVGDHKLLEEIGSIHTFSFSVSYQKSGAMATQAAQDALVSEGYAVLNDLFEATGVHHLDQLSAEPRAKAPDSQSANDSSEPLLEFLFGHDSQHCHFKFFEDRFVIERTSSSFQHFYEWYCNVMPEALRIEMTLRQIVQRATKRSLRPVRTSHLFVFNFCEFSKRSKGGQEKGRNMDVLAATVPQLPGNEEMVGLTKQELHRLDLTISKQEQIGDVSRNVWYRVEAPFNQNGRFIVFTAELRNSAAERLEQGSVLRTDPFDPDFGSEYRLALLEFLRDTALQGFASQLLGDWEFSTERNI